MARAGLARTALALAGLAALLLLALPGPARAGQKIDPGTLTGKLVMGYQGWFACPGDGAGLGWGHWQKGPDGPGTAVDMLPDVSDLPAAARCPTGMRDAAGKPIDLFDSQNPATVDRHFAWMQQAGLDGVALQRFASALSNPVPRRADDRVLANVRRAAEDHGRVFFVMYDLSGLAPAELGTVARDWARLEHEGIAASPAYQHHRGHPLLALWGLGFIHRKLTPADTLGLLDALEQASAPYGGVSFLGGVPSYWRTHGRDASPDPGWEKVWRRLAVLSPWAVGRFRDDAGADAYRRDVTEPDLAATRALGVDYMPVVFPGYSFANASRVRDPRHALKLNSIPRRCGRFYWRQVSNALGAGATMLYGAMFDEVNEGTALLPLLPAAALPVRGVPPGAAYVPVDADGCRLPSDWYLRLTGAATQALRTGAHPSPALPLALPQP